MLGRDVREGRRESKTEGWGEERLLVRGRNVNEKWEKEWRSDWKVERRMTRKRDTERKDSLLCSFP